MVSTLAIKANAETIKIGISVPLSGEAASYGEDVKNALLFANENLADSQYKFIIQDDQCSNKEAVNVAHNLVSLEKVKYVLGFACSGSVLSAAPVYEKNHIISIASATGAPAITKAGDYIFRTIPSLNVAAIKLYKEIAKKYKIVGIVSEETAYCQGLKEAFIKNNNKDEIKIVSENFLSDNLDLKSIFLKLKTQNIEALFLNPQTEAGLVRMVKQLDEISWKPRLYGTYYPGSPTYLNEFGTKGDDIIYADLPFPYQYLSKAGMTLYEKYIQKYGQAKSGDYNILLSFLSFQALHSAIQSHTDVKNFLYTQRFSGIVDDFGFDSNGDIDSNKVTFVLKTIKDGKPKEYE